jgi:hypothetical protein
MFREKRAPRNAPVSGVERRLSSTGNRDPRPVARVRRGGPKPQRAAKVHFSSPSFSNLSTTGLSLALGEGLLGRCDVAKTASLKARKEDFELP